MSRTAEVRAAHARWSRRRRRLMAYGLWEPWVDAGPVREHVGEVHATGIGYEAICRGAGLREGALRNLLWGRTGEPAVQIRRETAVALLAYWPALDDYPDGARIDACGTRRRLNALLVQGFTYAAVMPWCGLGADTLQHARVADRVTARVARAVRGAYDALWNRSPEEMGVRAVTAERHRRRFAAEGCLPALVWDDDTIDDPAAEPKTDVPRPAASSGADAVDRWLLGESVVLDVAGRRAALRYLMEWSALSVVEIGERLGVEGDSVARSWERIRERARVAGEPVPARRVYVHVDVEPAAGVAAAA